MLNLALWAKVTCILNILKQSFSTGFASGDFTVDIESKRRCTGIVYCVKFNFNGFMISASNSPHKTHCDRHKPCLCILQVNLYLMKSGVLVPCMILFMVSHGIGHICPCCRLSDLTKLLLPSVRLKYSRVQLDAQPLTNKKCHQLRTTILKKIFKMHLNAQRTVYCRMNKNKSNHVFTFVHSDWFNDKKNTCAIYWH